MIGPLLTVGLAVGAIWVGLPAVAQILTLLRIGSRRRPQSTPNVARPRLLFLVPAHDEELLIERCVHSLLDPDYSSGAYEVVVVADNCHDATALIARRAGATVLERRDVTARGKHAALDWALGHFELDQYDAIVVIDADAIVNREFATSLARWPDLRDRAIQAYDGLTNEFENWLTRLAGLFNRYRYDVELPLKAKAGLSVPLTGDGMVIGTRLLRRLGWQIETITEGWELYARYTLAGVTVDFEPGSIFFDQEAKSIRQGEAQRQRWAAGRLHVVRMYGWQVLTGPGVGLVQRVDMLAELLSLGPVQRGVASAIGILAILVLDVPASGPLLALFATGIIQPLILSMIVLRAHPEPIPTLTAFARLPVYAGWRVTIGLRNLLKRGTTKKWVRTGRHAEFKQQ